MTFAPIRIQIYANTVAIYVRFIIIMYIYMIELINLLLVLLLEDGLEAERLEYVAQTRVKFAHELHPKKITPTK